MKIRELPFEGFFEEVSGRTSERVQLVAPETDVDLEVLSWAILPQAETYEGDGARRDYVFRYALGRHIEDGLFVLHLSGRDASNEEHSLEIVAGLAATGGGPGAGRPVAYTPMWFISRRLHFKPVKEISDDAYPGTAFGRLRFEEPDVLPHRRLIGAAV
jgi:hypothetical protein